MNITLPDGRKATVVNQVNDKMVTIRFEDGRETMWPIDKLPKEKEGEDTLKLVTIPAIERLESFMNEMEKINKYGEKAQNPITADMSDAEYGLFVSLRQEAIKEYKQKWGLI